MMPEAFEGEGHPHGYLAADLVRHPAEEGAGDAGFSHPVDGQRER